MFMQYVIYLRKGAVKFFCFLFSIEYFRVSNYCAILYIYKRMHAKYEKRDVALGCFSGIGFSESNQDGTVKLIRF